MSEHDVIEPLLVVATAILCATLIAKLARKLGLPASVGFMLFGIGLRALDVQFDLVSADSTALLALLGEIGVAVLLFRVGLESDLGKLIAELPRATLVWVSNVALSAGLGFAVAWGLGLGLVPSLFVAVALSATSIGLSVMIWRDAGRLDTPMGALLVDVAELDDLSAIVMTSLLVIAAPMLAGGEVLPGQLGAAFGWMAVKIVGFGVACVLFSRYLEEPLTRAFVHDEGDRSATAVLFLVGTVVEPDARRGRRRGLASGEWAAGGAGPHDLACVGGCPRDPAGVRVLPRARDHAALAPPRPGLGPPVGDRGRDDGIMMLAVPGTWVAARIVR